MSGDCHRSLDLLANVVHVHVCNRIAWQVVVRVALAGIIIFNLDCRSQSLRTEGDFVPSGTAGDNSRDQVKLVGQDGVAHHLG